MPTENLVHAVCNYRAPSLFTHLLASEEGEVRFLRHISTRYDDGNLPLHLAVQSSYFEGYRAPNNRLLKETKEITASTVNLLLRR